MKTYRLWFESDSEFPRFQRLGFEEADVAIADVLKQGIHPALGDDNSTSIAANEELSCEVESAGQRHISAPGIKPSAPTAIVPASGDHSGD